jgi:hypothetical protein
VGSAFDDLSTWRSELEKVYAVFERLAPFSPDNDRFNAFYVDTLESGFCHYFCHGVERLLCCSIATARRLANRCFPTGTNLQTIVVHADSKYGGAGYHSSNVATTSIHPRGPRVAIHELGHSLFELADEYSSGAGTSSSPNCESRDSGCPKWSDLIPRGFGVTCGGISGCRDSGYVVGETSFMRFLSSPIGNVNLRFTCCAFQALTKAMPAYCAEFDWANGNLLQYCKNDYQKFGGPGAYENDALPSLYYRQTAASPRTSGVTGGQYGSVRTPKVISVMGAAHEGFVSTVNEGPSGLYRRQQLLGGFQSVAASRARGVQGHLLRVEITFSEGPPEVLLMDPTVAVDVPPLEEGEQDKDRVAGDVSVMTDVVDIVVDDDREVLLVAVKLVPPE